MIHRQHLVTKKMSARLHDALSVVIKVLNHIKSNSLQDRLFHEFCKQLNKKKQVFLTESKEQH